FDRSQDADAALHDAREILGRGGFRILAEQLGNVDSHALGATAREEEPHFWQVGGLLPDVKRRHRICFDLMLALEEELGCHVASFSTSTCVYKVMGAPGVLGQYGEINTIEQLRQEARMLGIQIQPGNSDSQDLSRVVDHLIRVDGLSLAEAMETVVPPIVDEIRSLPEDLRPFYMYLRETFGPFAQGPVALI